MLSQEVPVFELLGVNVDGSQNYRFKCYGAVVRYYRIVIYS